MSIIQKSFFRSTDRLPMLEDVKSALDERIAMGDLTPLVSDRVLDPLGYIGLMATEIATQTPKTEGGIL